MKLHGFAALTAIIAMLSAGSAIAGEMRKDGHASLTTARAEPIPIPEPKPAAVETRALAVSKPAEKSAMSSMNQGYTGRKRLRHTVYLTN